MARQTSINAYKEIKNEGLLSKKRFEVYSALFKKGPLTATQIVDNINTYTSPSVGYNVHARLGELKELNVIDEYGTKKCPLTGKTVILWDVTNKLPRKPSKKAVLLKQIKYHEERLEKLVNKYNELYL